MKTFLAAAMLFICAVTNAQYGDQDSIRVPIVDQNTHLVVMRSALIHYPDDYNTDLITRHPLFIYIPGKNHGGDNITGDATTQNLMDNGFAYYFKTTSWNGYVTNPLTLATEKPIFISIRAQDYGFDEPAIQAFLKWAYTQSTWRIDTTRTACFGFSAGGRGFVWYAMHRDLIPQHKLNWIISSAGDVNCCDDVSWIVKDSVRFLGTGYAQYDSHAYNTRNEIILCNNIKSGYANFINNPEPNACGIGSDGHCNATTRYTYNPNFDTVYTDNNYSFSNVSLYQIALLYSQGVYTAPTQSITTTTVSSLNFCVTVSSGATGNVSFTTNGTIASDNVYTVQLSSPSGSFQSPVNIGTWANNATSGNISFTIPANTAPGNAYCIRVINQTTIGSPNANNITVTLATNSIAPTAAQNIAVNANGATLTVNEPSAPLSRSWWYGTVLGNYNINTNISTVNFTPNFSAPGKYYVVCKSIYACGLITSNVVQITVVAASSSNYIVTKSGSNCGIYWGTGNAGDSLFLDQSVLGTICYATFHDLHGTTAKPIVIINKGRILDSGDYQLLNCTHIKLTGTGTSGLLYGLVADGRVNDSSENNKGGSGITLAGTCNNIEIDHVLVKNKGSLGKNASGVDLPAGYGIVIKNDILCDSSAKWPVRFDSISVYDCKFDSASQDIVYLVSSDPYGTQRTANCNGVIVQYRPTGASNIRFERDTFMNAGRSFQTGGADTGFNVVTNCYFYNLGTEFNSSQGGVAFGAANNTWHFYNNTIRKTWKGVYSYNYSVFDYHNNINDSAGWANGDSIVTTTTLATTLPPGTTHAYIKNGQAHYIGLHRNNNISALTTYAYDNPNHSTLTLRIFNNTQTNCTSPYKIQLQPGDFMYAQTGSCIQNSGNVYDPFPSQIKYDTDCGSILWPVWQHVQINHDTTKTVPVMHVDSTSTTTTIGADTTLWRKFKGVKGLAKVIKTPGTRTVVTYDTTYTDSAIHYTIPFDTLEVNYISQQPQFGIFYFSNGTVPVAKQVDTAFYCNVSMLRSNITRGGGSNYNVPYINSRNAKAVLVVGNSSDGAPGIKHYVDSLFKLGKAYLYCLQNEPAINCTNIAAFLNDFDSTIDVAHGYGIPVADGGFEKTIVYSWVHWMVRNGKSDSATIVISAGSLDTTSSPAIMYQQRNDSLLDAYAGMKHDFSNFHWYEPNIHDTSATVLTNYLPAIVNYIKVRTGKPVITTETGPYNHDCVLHTALLQQWKDIGTAVITDFDGVGNDGNAVKLQECIKAAMLLLQ